MKKVKEQEEKFKELVCNNEKNPKQVLKHKVNEEEQGNAKLM